MQGASSSILNDLWPKIHVRGRSLFDAIGNLIRSVFTYSSDKTLGSKVIKAVTNTKQVKCVQEGVINTFDHVINVTASRYSQLSMQRRLSSRSDKKP